MDVHELSKALAKATTTVTLAGLALGLSKNAAYAAVKSGEIPSLRIGGAIRVPTVPLRRMLGMVPEQEAA
jgi:hypothetical protein